MAPARNPSFVILALTWATSAALAGGSIWDPPHLSSLIAGSNIQPAGSVDPIHIENSESLKVDVGFFKNASAGGSLFLIPNIPIMYGTDWWAWSDMPVPGGDYVGGTWQIILFIDDVQAAVASGPIISGE